MTTIHLCIPYIPGAEAPDVLYPPGRWQSIDALYEAAIDLDGASAVRMSDYLWGHPVVPYGRKVVVTLSGTYEERIGDIWELLARFELLEGAEVGPGDGPGEGPREPDWE
jgi:hypothetical protein